MTFKELLINLSACQDARQWAGDMSIENAVANCYRGDWLLWLAKRIDMDERKLALAKGYCANTVRHLMEDNRSINAIDAAIAYGNGEITKEELKNAYAAAYAAAADAAAYAAAAAADAAAADAAAADAAAAVDAAARIENQMKTADICRKLIGKEIINKVNELLNPHKHEQVYH